MTRHRKLAPEEAALWAKVVSSVTPLHRAKPRPAKVEAPEPAPAPAPPPAPARIAPPRAQRRSAPAAPKPETLHGATLDASWDRRLSRGLVAPESTIDLHGHNLDSAYQRLDHGLERAIQRGDRVLLLVTGRPPRPESERPHARGAIRAAVHDWLAASRHADRIAVVRGAHPTHGGGGALYIVLRRDRSQRPPIF